MALLEFDNNQLISARLWDITEDPIVQRKIAYRGWELNKDKSILTRVPRNIPVEPFSPQWINLELFETSTYLVFRPHPLDVWAEYPWLCRVFSEDAYLEWRARSAI